jgi:ribonuclease BN (tRNA processing enzyme)
VFPIHIDQFHGEIVTVDIGAEDFSIGAAKIMARPIPHSGVTLGFRVESEGRTVAYLPDHQAPPDRRGVPDAVFELCQGADLVIHDGQYTDDEFSRKPDWGHSTAAYAVHVATEAGARRLMLSHHDPSHNDRELDRILNRARRLPEAKRLEDVSAAHEAQSVDLGRA